MFAMENDFVCWLTTELDTRGWTNSELARRADVGFSTVSRVFSRQQNPGLDFCIGVARALDLPPEDVLRRAGLLPPLPPSVTEEREIVTQVGPFGLVQSAKIDVAVPGWSGGTWRRRTVGVINAP